MQIKKITKVVNYYRDNLGRKLKKEVKNSKEKRGRRAKLRTTKFHRGCEISQHLRNCSIFCLPSGLPFGSTALISN